MNTSKRVGIWIRVVKDYIVSFAPINAKILDSEETVIYAKKERKSIIRFGDGEFRILDGGDVHYQVFDNELQKNMQYIVETYSEESPYLLCMPYKYFSSNNLVLNKRVLISCWSTPKKMFRTMVNPKATYGDAFVFAKKNQSFYKELWRDYSTIIMLHNDRRYFANAYNTESQKGFFIQVPSRDSFAEIDKIERKVIEIYDIEQLSKERTVILVSAGPMAKVLTFRLAQKGYMVIDCGHIWDDPLEV